LDVFIQRLQTLGGNVLGGSTGYNGGAIVPFNSGNLGPNGGLGGSTSDFILGNLGPNGGLGGSTSYGLPSWSDCDKLIRDGSIS
jgi:hypothetical protein